MESFLKSTEDWLKNHKELSLDSVSKNENRLTFKISENVDQTFYVICPEKNSPWHVWSDCAELLGAAGSVSQDLKNTSQIDEVLSTMLHELTIQKLNLDESEKSDESDDEEPEDNEEYDDDEDEEQFDDDYYKDEETDLDRNDSEKSTKLKDEVNKHYNLNTHSLSIARLAQDYKSLLKSDGKFGVVGSPRQDNIYNWDVQLTDFPKTSKLFEELITYEITYKHEPVLELKVVFPYVYPMAPPFIRLVRPRFKHLSAFVTTSGSICMEVLTKLGWTPTCEIENILIQIRTEIMCEPNPVLHENPDRKYTKEEAEVAFNRSVHLNGWDGV